MVHSPRKVINEQNSASSIFRCQQWADSDERVASHSTSQMGRLSKSINSHGYVFSRAFSGGWTGQALGTASS